MRSGRHHGHASETNDVGCQFDGCFGKQYIVYMPEEDVYRCPAGEQLK